MIAACWVDLLARMMVVTRVVWMVVNLAGRLGNLMAEKKVVLLAGMKVGLWVDRMVEKKVEMKVETKVVQMVDLWVD